jgi:3-hydroxyisobutyrate dehydrogenase
VKSAVGVIGTGAMGLGVVQSLVRAGIAVHARDIRAVAQAAAVASGAVGCGTPSAVVRNCGIVLILVVDAAEVDAVIFGADGALSALEPGAIVVLSSTVAPSYVAMLSSRLSSASVRLVDAPVSGGPQRAAAGTMTLIVSGEKRAIADCDPVFTAMAARRFIVGELPGMAATYKVLNNQLAAANLAAGAEAMAVAIRAGLDPHRFLEVVNASSGASWIVDDRMRRALDGDTTPRAAMALLHKDVGLAVDVAAAFGCEVPVALAARVAFAAAMAAGYGAEDDASLLRLRLGPTAPKPR